MKWISSTSTCYAQSDAAAGDAGEWQNGMPLLSSHAQGALTVIMTIGGADCYYDCSAGGGGGAAAAGWSWWWWGVVGTAL